MLKETLSQTDLVAWPLFAFLLFMAVFLFVVVRVWFFTRAPGKARYAELERLPLADDDTFHQETSR